MLYRVLLFVHISAVVVWVGSGFLFQMFTEHAASTGDMVTLTAVVRQGERLGKALFVPASLLVLATGLWLVFEGAWGFDHLFVAGEVVGVISSIVLGAVVIGPTTKRLARVVTSATSMTPDVRTAATRLRNTGRLDLAIMALVIFLMTVKPGS